MQLQLIDNTLFIDNSRYENFTECDRKGQYAIVLRRVPSDFNAPLFCGEVVHLGLQFRYLYYPVDKPIPPECVWKMRYIAKTCYDNNPEVVNMKPDEYRTADYVAEVLTKYCAMYPTEPFTILSHKDRPIVERSFAVPLGEIDGIKVVWIGRLDLGIADVGGELWVFDNKTSSMGGDYFSVGFNTSNQMQGYTLSLNQVLRKPIQGVIINTLITRAITKTGKGVEFQRFKFRYSYEKLEAWRMNVLTQAGDFLHCNKRDFFPMRTTQCIRRYGQCPYLKTCMLDPDQRMADLMSGAYKDDEFSPMHKDLINLEQVYGMDLPPGWESEMLVKPETKKGVDVAALVNDLVRQTSSIQA